MIEINSVSGLPKLYNFTNDFINNNATNKIFSKANPYTLIILSAIILFYYILFKSLNITKNPTDSFGMPASSSGIKLIEIIMWGLFLFLILINGVQYFFNVDIKAIVKNLFSPVPEIDISITSNNILDVSSAEVKPVSEVFHISKNKYTYDDAKAICKAYKSEMATYEQIESAYKDGAEWCSYGWSEDQLALYPTQQKTWDDLQEIDEHKNDCGRPGINGGFIDNKNVKYGVNCYGVKPKSRPLERKLMNSNNILPTSKEEKIFNKKVLYYKDNISNILISPFNYTSWSD
jgi:hypothetical protein